MNKNLVYIIFSFVLSASVSQTAKWEVKAILLLLAAALLLYGVYNINKGIAYSLLVLYGLFLLVTALLSYNMMFS